ncbi:MAG TPA: tetratricopeptide repeat protein, partial [Chromatiales bacterium]|nr:tetratricopeptide repeat protein [Chromatiales bacterium]
ATVLGASGVETHPEALVGQVYVPARQGSLQLELLAASRRAGRIPYVIEPSLQALVAELGAGRPVLVLQNLGVSFMPALHYAVVVGVDPREDRIILRSGVERRHVLTTRAFLRTWNLSNNWGMVVLQPGELPEDGDQGRYLKAVASAEQTLPNVARLKAYRAALKRWPESITAQFGLAHAHYAVGDLTAAKRLYTSILQRNPRHAAARNNLAQVLSELGCRDQAYRMAQRALEIAREDSPEFVDAIGETLDALPKAHRDGPDCPGDDVVELPQ